MRIFIVGASGGVGQHLVKEAAERGHEVTAQSRASGKVPAGPRITEAVGSPLDRDFLAKNMSAHDAAVMTLGIDSTRTTTLFSDATRAMLEAMSAAHVRRLVAVTGIGAGETRGHGGWFYNSVIYPLFTRNRYEDKERQEALIEKSGLDWTIVRPAPYSERSSSQPLTVIAGEIPRDLQLRTISRAEVASFILEALETGKYVRTKPFIGHE